MPRPSGRLRRLLTGALVPALLASSLGLAIASPASAACPSTAWDEISALAAAKSCGSRVEVGRLHDESTRVWANPSGNLTAEAHATPQWVKKDGAWAGVDPSLKLGADGVVRPVAALAQLELGDGGDGTLVSMAAGDGRFGLNWPTALPAPVLSGAIATYPEVFPGVDLQVQSQVEGFSYTLKVKTPEAAANPALAAIKLKTELEGDIEVARGSDGVIRVAEPEGDVLAVSPGASMWDTPAQSRTMLRSAAPAVVADQPAPRVSAEIPVELKNDVLTVKPDLGLLTGDAVNFPVYIDPPFSASRQAWAPVHREEPDTTWWNDSSWPRNDSVFVGYQGWVSDRASGVWRSMVKMDVAGIRGSTVSNVKFKILLDHSGDCKATDVDLWNVKAIWRGDPTSWNTTKDNWATYLATTAGNANQGGGCGSIQPNQWLSFSSSALTGKVQDYANANLANMTFGLRAPNEADRNQWKRFALNTAMLELDYNYVPDQPDQLAIDPGGQCSASTLPVNSVTPTLSARVSSKSSEMKAHIEVMKGSTKVIDYVSGTLAANATGGISFPWKVNQTLAEGSTYQWRVRGENGSFLSPWSPYCSFTIDTTAPAAKPVITQTTMTAKVGVPVVFSVSPNGAADAVAVDYAISGDAPEASAPIVDGVAKVVVDAPKVGTNTLYAWLRDAAGNRGARGEPYQLTVQSAPVPEQAALWHLDGGFNEANNASLNMTAGGGWSNAGDVGSVNSAMATTGASCAKTTVPVVPSDKSFSISTWVKLTDTSDNRVILSQGDAGKAGFVLRYDVSGHWVFEIPRGDAATLTWDRVTSKAEAKKNAWTQLVAINDADEGVIRLYVNGELQGWATRMAEPSTDGVFSLGCADGAAPFIGTVDEVAVWKGVTPIKSAVAATWEFGSDRWIDSSFKGNDFAALYNDTIVPDRSGFIDNGATAFDLNGYGKTLNPVIRTDQSFSITAWVKLSSDAGHQTIFSQAAVERPGVYLKYNPLDGGGSRWSFEMPNADVASPTAWNQVFSDAPAAKDTWTHIAATFDASTKQMRLYINGVKQATVTTVANPLWNSTGPSYVGAASRLSANETWSGLRGALDRISVYRGVLTDNDIQNEYQAG